MNMVDGSHGGGTGGKGRVIIYYETASVNITFDANMPQRDVNMNAAIPANTTITYGSAFGDKLNWQNDSYRTSYRRGYTFGGWYTNPQGTGTPITSSSTSTFTSDQTLYAKWTPVSMTVQYHRNGGQWASGHTPSPSNATYTVSYGSTYRDQMTGFDWTLPVRSGYVFMGWNTKNDGSGLFFGPDAHVGLTENHHLYAYWVEEENLPPAITTCYEGTSQLCAPSNYSGYTWSPAAGLSSTTGKCVTLTSANMSSNNVTYTCTYAKGNVANFDFSQGNAGFSSDYEIVEDVTDVNNELQPERAVSVTDCWGHVHSSLDQACTLTSYEGDEGGKFLAVNGGAVANAVVYEQTIAVTRNTNYRLSAMYANAAGTGDITSATARLMFFVNGVRASAETDTAFANEHAWKEMYTTWNSGSNDFATIQIRDFATATSGNDFALDHILFEAQTGTESGTYTVTVTRRQQLNPGAVTSETETITRGQAFSKTITPSTPIGGDGNYKYQWYVNGTAISGATGASLTIPTDPYTNVPGTYEFKRFVYDESDCGQVYSNGSYTLTVLNNLSLTLDCPEASGNCYSFPNATFQGYATHVTVSFSDDPTGCSLNLPSYVTTDNGFEVAHVSDYSKKIVLPDGYTAAQIQQLIRDISFCIPAGTHNSIRISADMSASEENIFYFSGNDHYYKYVPYTSADGSLKWTDVYNLAKNSTLYGRKGYLATLSTREEDLFMTKVSSPVAWIGGTRLLNTGDDSSNPQYYAGFNTGGGSVTGYPADSYWYWACGPEKGQIIVDRPTANKSALAHNLTSWDDVYAYQEEHYGAYSNWGEQEPNDGNRCDNLPCADQGSDGECCLTILNLTNITGYAGHTENYSWNDVVNHSNYMGSYQSDYTPRGYLIEYGDKTKGNIADDVFDANEMVQAVGNIGTFELTAETPICNGNTSTLTATPTFAPYKWYEGTTTTGTPLQQGSDNTFTTPALTADATYTVVANDDQCAYTKTVTVVVNPTLTAPASITYNENICNGNDVTFTATGGTGTDADIRWSTTSCADVTSTSPSGATFTLTKAPGTYTVYADRPGACHSGSCKSVQIIIPEPLTIAQFGTITPAKCKGDHNGEFKFTVSGGTPNYTVSVKKGTADVPATQISNSGNTYTVSNLSAGTYTVSVTDAHNCTATGTTSYEVTEPAETLTATAALVNPDSCQGNKGKATVTPAGGNGSYEFRWSDGQTSQTATGLSSVTNSGAYTVTVTDAKGCTANASVTVTLYNPLAMNDITGPTICTGNEFVITPANGTNGVIPTGTTYSWPEPENVPDCVGGTGLQAKNNQTVIRGVLTSTCSESKTITYMVTPKNGVCVGNASGVTVTVTATVNPGITVAMDNASAVVKCSNAPAFDLDATFVNSFTNYTAVWTRKDVATGTETTVATHNHTHGTMDTCRLTVNLDDDVCSGEYVYKVTYTGVDAVGCSAADAYTVQVNAGDWTLPDNGEETVECISAATPLALDLTASPVVLDSRFPTVTDGCGRTLNPVFVGKELQPTSFTCKGKIIYKYRYTACDNSYKDWTYTFNIEDKTKPSVNVTGFSGQIAANIDQTKCEFSVPDLTATVRAMSSDNCIATSNLTISQDKTAGTVITAATQVSVHVIDSCGNDSTIVITVTVPTLPTITEITSTDVTCHNGSNGTATVTPASGTAPYTYKWNDAANQTTNPAENLVAGSYKVTVTDANGCTVESTPVTVTQPDALSISGCLSNITKNTDTGKEYATVNLTMPTFSPTGNGATLSITYSPSTPTNATTTNASGQYPIGTTTVTIKAVNTCPVDATLNEEVSCTPFTVKVEDKEKPAITSCGATGDQTVTPNDGPNNYHHTGSAWDATATDNSGAAPTLTWKLVKPDGTVVNGGDSHTLNGQNFPYGVTKVTWTATDAAGNAQTCTFNVEVIDNTDPVITCASTTNQTVVPNTTGNIYTFVGTENWEATATDNVGVDSIYYTLSGATVSATHNTSMTGQQFNYGTTLVTWTATDAAGNFAECSFNVIVEDVTPPEITCAVSGNKAKDNDAGEGYHTHHESEEVWNASATDNSGTVASLYYKVMGKTTVVDGSNTTLEGQKFNIGTTTVRWYATDPVGNIDSCEFTVTVTDTTKPCIDNCEPGVNPGPTCETIGSPSVNSDNNQNYYTHGGTAWDVKGKDNSGVDPVMTWTMTHQNGTTVNGGTSSTLAGQTFLIGKTTVTWRATDAAGNFAECTFVVTVIDNQDPCIGCDPDDVDPTNPTKGVDCDDIATRINNQEKPTDVDKNYYTHSNADWDITAWDNCGVLPTLTWSLNNPDAPTGVVTSGSNTLNGVKFYIGTTTVTWTATDTSGKASTCTFTVRVKDTQIPTFTKDCAAIGNQVENTDAGSDTYLHSGTDWDATATDNSGVPPTLTWSLVEPDGTNVDGATTTHPSSLDGVAFKIGVTNVTWTATDNTGNPATCSFTVTVNDNQPPVISSCAANITTGVECISDVPAPYINYDQFVAAGGSVTDNDGINTATFGLKSQTQDGNICPRTITRTYKIQDNSGNESTCEQTITVWDKTDPQIATTVISTKEADRTGCVYSYPDLTEIVRVGSTDNCTPTANLTITQDKTAGETIAQTSSVQSLPVVVTVTDSCGNSTTKTINVTVPALLAATFVTTNETCEGSNGTATLTVTGGTPFTTGSETFYLYNWSNSQSSNPATGLQEGDYSVVVTDDHGCTLTKDPIHITLDNPYSSTLTTSYTRTICSGGTFEVEPADMPANTTYSWTAPTSTTLSGMTSGTDEISISNTLNNLVTTPQTITYEVDPKHGVCAGSHFSITVNVQVTVNPTVLSEVPDLVEICPGDNVNLTASLGQIYSTHEIKWYFDGTLMNTVSNIAAPTGGTETQTYAMNMSSYTSCDAEYPYSITYTDATGCESFANGTVKVRIPAWSITTADGEGTASCLADVVAPHTLSPSVMPVVKDGCNKTLTYSGPAITTTGDNCNGTVTYTYTYTACDNSHHDWKYVYTISDETKPTISTGYETAHNANVNNCVFTIPDLREVVRPYAQDNCATAASQFTMTQDPAPGTVVTPESAARNIEVKVYATDPCSNTSDAATLYVAVPAQLTLTVVDYNSQCYGQNDGYIDYSVNGGKLPYIVTLYGTTTSIQTVNDNNTHSFTYLPDYNNYRIGVVDANGCTVTTETAISVQQISDNLVVTAQSDSWEYDGNAHTKLFYDITFGTESYTGIASGASQTLSNGDVVTATVSGTITHVTESNVDNVVTSIEITRGGTDITCFYNKVPTNGALTITPSENGLELTCPSGTSLTKMYDATPLNPAATATAIPGTGDTPTVEYSLTGTDGWSTMVPSITEVGTLHVYVRATHSDYVSKTCDYILEVTKRPGSDLQLECPTATNATWMYDGNPHSVEATANPTHGGTMPTIEYSLTGTDGWSTTAPSITSTTESPKHVYVRATHPNYDDATCDFVMEITKAGPDKQNLECPNVADSSWVYDGNAHYAYATANPIGGETPTIEYSLDSVNWSTDAKSITYVTESPKHVFVRSTHPNYEDAACGFDLVISPADDIHVQMNCPTAANSTWTYDGDSHSATASATSNIVSGEVFTIEYSLDSLAWSTTAPSITTVPESPRHVYVRALNPNYETATCEYDLVINKKKLNITGNFEKVYDGTPLEVSYSALTYDGLVNGEMFTSGVITTDGYQVGDYYCLDNQFLRHMADLFAYNSGFGPSSMTKNYEPKFEVKLSITKRSLELTARSKEKEYDGTPLTVSDLTAPGYDITSGSLADADVVKDTITSVDLAGWILCVGDSASKVSNAVIKHGDDIVTDSYTITYVNGHLVVKPVPTSLECPADLSIMLWYGRCDTMVTLPAAATLTPPVDNTTIVNDLAGQNPLPVGTHHIKWSLLDACGNVMQTCTQAVTVQYPPCGRPEDTVRYDGFTYHTVRVGCECWLQENLRNTHYADGTDVPGSMVYGDDPANEEDYGRLYTWYSAVKVPEGDNTAVPADSVAPTGGTYVKGICPDGWALPTSAQYDDLWLNGYGTNGVKDKDTRYWLPGYAGTDPNSHFNARGAGYYDPATGRYYNLLGDTYFWSSDESTDMYNGYCAVITHICPELMSQKQQKGRGQSVRCVQKR